MSVSSFANEKITRLRYGTKTERGGEVVDWASTPAELDIDGCYLEPTESEIVVDGRRAVRTGYRIAMPPGSIVLAQTDRVRIYGLDYQCDGDSLQVPSPTGLLAHAQLTVYRWKG